jgi:hypothetical protein
MEILVLVMFQKEKKTLWQLSSLKSINALHCVVKFIVQKLRGELFLWIIIWDFGMFGACQLYILRISAIELRKL